MDMFYKCQGLMDHKVQVMERLLKEAQKALKSDQTTETEIMSDLMLMECKVLIEDENLLVEENMTSKFTNRVNSKFEIDDFGAHTIIKFATYKFSMKH